jgi:hypothetical protein
MPQIDIDTELIASAADILDECVPGVDPIHELTRHYLCCCPHDPRFVDFAHKLTPASPIAVG